MDHNNSDEGKCSCGADKKNCANCQTCKGGKGKDNSSEKKYCMCEHGMCKDHSPEWKNMSKAFLSPNPSFFGAKTYWLERCCRAGMTRTQKVQLQLCTKCGRTQIKVLVKEVALCKCCGYHFKIEEGMQDSSNYDCSGPTVP